VLDEAREARAGVFGVTEGGAMTEGVGGFSGEVEGELEFFADGLELFEDPRGGALVTLGGEHGTADSEQVADRFALELTHRTR